MSSENVEIVRRMLDHYMSGELDQALFADREEALAVGGHLTDRD